MNMREYEVIIIGAGAAGLMCALAAGQRGRTVLVIDHANKVGKKILLSGGGRCNFTNLYAAPDHYLSTNPFFCISALSRYTQADFENLVKKHRVLYHEKKAGQLFCDESAQAIVQLLLKECEEAGVQFSLRTTVIEIKKSQSFKLETSLGALRCNSLVIASGGLSFPTMGASPYGYKVAEAFGLKVLPVRAALVPLTLHPFDLNKFSSLSGVSVDVSLSVHGQVFKEALLFTHRGLSGPAILQISSYWQPGDTLEINFLPDLDVPAFLQEKKGTRPRTTLKTLLAEYLPMRLIQVLFDPKITHTPINAFSDQALLEIIQTCTAFRIKPNGTEGYRTAEVTLGGVDTNELSSKTFESKKVPGLYFIGEVLDVTGHLGGFNFQWAWSSGFCAGQFV